MNAPIPGQLPLHQMLHLIFRWCQAKVSTEAIQAVRMHCFRSERICSDLAAFNFTLLHTGVGAKATGRLRFCFVALPSPALISRLSQRKSKILCDAVFERCRNTNGVWRTAHGEGEKKLIWVRVGLDVSLAMRYETAMTTQPQANTDSSFKNSSGEIRFKRANRRQIEMVTLSLEQRIDVDHPVRAVWSFVEQLDLSQLYGTIKAFKGTAGAAPIDPRILFALWIYATLRGISSGRRINELCDPQLGETAYQWLCGGVSVNYHTINDFRSAHPECLDRCLTQSVGVLIHEGLVSLDRVAQDGMRVRADASGKSFRREPSLEECLKQAEEQVKLLREESVKDSSAGNRRQQAAKERHAADRKQRIERALEQIKDVQAKAEKRKKGAGEKARCSTTDPDARRMKMGDGGFRPAFNVQFATTADSRVIVGVDVTNVGSDSGEITPMLDQLEGRFGVRPREALVDGGFVSNDDITSAEVSGTTIFAPVKEEDKKRKKGIDPFAPVKGDTPELAAWRMRMGTAEAQEIYQSRAGIAEFSNAGCRNRGLAQFSVRGLVKVKCEVMWQVLASVFQRGCNLRKLSAEGVI